MLVWFEVLLVRLLHHVSPYFVVFFDFYDALFQVPEVCRVLIGACHPIRFALLQVGSDRPKWYA